MSFPAVSLRDARPDAASGDVSIPAGYEPGACLRLIEV